MKVQGLDGREYPWKLDKYVVYKNDRRKRSELHLRCREILNKLVPTYRICEEVSLPGSGKLKLDFFIPDLNLAIEVHGRQHYEYVPFFHGTRMDFMRSKMNDGRKIEWCDENNIVVVELPYNEDDDEWERRIRNYASEEAEDSGPEDGGATGGD